MGPDVLLLLWHDKASEQRLWVLLLFGMPEMVSCTAVSQRILVLGRQVDSSSKVTP